MRISCFPIHQLSGYNENKSQSKICNKNLLSKVAQSSCSCKLGEVLILSPLGDKIKPYVKGSL